jgi:hypothetical protein
MHSARFFRSEFFAYAARENYFQSFSKRLFAVPMLLVLFHLD